MLSLFPVVFVVVAKPIVNAKCKMLSHLTSLIYNIACINAAFASRSCHTAYRMSHITSHIRSFVAQVLTLQGYGKEADLWSVGVIMFLLLCGKLPFDGEDHNEIIRSTIQVCEKCVCYVVLIRCGCVSILLSVCCLGVWWWGAVFEI